MRHCSLRWSRLAVPLGVGGRITTIRARTPDSNGRHLPSSPSPSIRAGIWRCATPRAPRQLPSLTPPNRAIQTPEANSRLDKTWGQGHSLCFFYRNIDASHHAMECLEVGARIDNGDAHFGLSSAARLL